ncbi:cell division regulator GpsB [Aciduricibacillus chroicocephali]|uniref:Cell cycle protein GpsB n=1 Tax=Aciduricibacillus chroicocephali TaxID=3054939 RepID=A0ABY9KZU6_9BACI|nr:cell division regulator GpsB [Bacillaceae bacterium 44XB]
MSLNRVQLSAKDILEKDFKTTMRGYNQEEVDEFLDIIIQDYEFLQQEIEKLQMENERLKKNNDQVPRQRSNVQQQSPAQSQPHQVNYDVLKRLSNLEKAVFGKKFADPELDS